MWEKKHLRFITEMITCLLGKTLVCISSTSYSYLWTTWSMIYQAPQQHCSPETSSSSLLMTFRKICPCVQGICETGPLYLNSFVLFQLLVNIKNPTLTSVTSQKWSYIYAYLINSKHEYTVLPDILIIMQNIFISLLCFPSLTSFSFLPSIPSTL